MANKGTFQKLLSGFCPLRGYPPPPYPLNGKSFCQKSLSGKGLKMHEKTQKIEFSNLKYLLFSGIGGYPPPPLTENHPAQKPLTEKGGTPLP